MSLTANYRLLMSVNCFPHNIAQSFFLQAAMKASVLQFCANLTSCNATGISIYTFINYLCTRAISLSHFGKVTNTKNYRQCVSMSVFFVCLSCFLKQNWYCVTLKTKKKGFDKYKVLFQKRAPALAHTHIRQLFLNQPLMNGSTYTCLNPVEEDGYDKTGASIVG